MTTNHQLVFPTPVGVNRMSVRMRRRWRRFPHTRGGEPARAAAGEEKETFPHTRGGEPRLGV